MEIYESLVARHIARDQPYALLDYPDYNNIGDSAIYAGELAFFDKHVGRAPGFVCTYRGDLNDMGARVPEGPIFLQGGGNFGDIWHMHQDFRLAVLKRFPDRRIIQLPQSIHFGDDAALQRTARAISDHGDFVLLVRDRHSFDLAKDRFDCDVQLCPDAAMMMWKLPIQGAAERDDLVMLRQDAEAVDNEARLWLKAHYPVEDWVRDETRTLPMRIIGKLSRSLPEPRLAMRLREIFYRREAKARVMAGVRQLSRGQRIVSDRLHVHLLSCLMRKPHVVLDNSYGKISRYIEAWGQDTLTERVTSADHLRNILHR